MPGFNVTLEPIVTNITVKALQAVIPLLKAFSIGAEMGKKSLNDQAKVFLLGAPEDPAAFNTSSNHYETATAPDVDEVLVTLNKLQKITKKVTRQQLRSGLVLQSLIDSMVRKVALAPTKDAALLITAADFGAPVHTGAATTMTADIVADLAGVAADAGWDEQAMHLVLSTPYYTNLVKDDDIKTLGGADAEAQVKTGIVQTLSGVIAYRYPGLVGPALSNLTGFFTDGTGLAIAYAENELEMGVEKKLEMYQVVSIPGGPVVSIRLHGSEKTNEAFLTVECLTGALKARTSGLRRIISAAP